MVPTMPNASLCTSIVGPLPEYFSVMCHIFCKCWFDATNVSRLSFDRPYNYYSAECGSMKIDRFFVVSMSCCGLRAILTKWFRLVTIDRMRYFRSASNFYRQNFCFLSILTNKYIIMIIWNKKNATCIR